MNLMQMMSNPKALQEMTSLFDNLKKIPEIVERLERIEKMLMHKEIMDTAIGQQKMAVSLYGESENV